MLSRIFLSLYITVCVAGCAKISNDSTVKTTPIEPPVFGVGYADSDCKEIVTATPIPIENTEPTKCDVNNKDKQQNIKEPSVAQECPKTFLESLDIFLQSKTALLLAFILLQWLHLLYYIHTGEKSGILQKITDTLYKKLGILQKLLYICLKRSHYKKNPEKTRLPK